jgi:ribosomal protein S18 acetylase RimI-like enzyme
MRHENSAIRTYRPGDDDGLYDVCLRTGANGGDATALYADGRLPGEVYVGPYLQLAPQFAFVVADDEGVAGYVLGAPDTRAFEAACEQDWWPPLRARYPRDTYPDGTADARIVRMIHDPPVAADHVVAAYPAHLHIDLLPRVQGRGYGRALMATLFDALSSAGAEGVHLGVAVANERAIGFYRRMGFEELERSDTAIMMGRSLMSS